MQLQEMQNRAVSTESRFSQPTNHPSVSDFLDIKSQAYDDHSKYYERLRSCLREAHALGTIKDEDLNEALNTADDEAAPIIKK